jgi:succinoglycan biosynthesis transport protein ExoP
LPLLTRGKEQFLLQDSTRRRIDADRNRFFSARVLLRKGQIMSAKSFRVLGVVGLAILLARAAWGAEEQQKEASGPRGDEGYTAKAYFRVSAVRPNLLGPRERMDEKEFEIIKNTQAEYLKINWVLGAALRNPEINQLPIVKRQKDPMKWLSEQLSVTFPGKAEVMEISITTPEPKDAVAIVNAVVDAYQNEVLNSEQDRRRHRLEDLEGVYADIEREIRERRVRLRNLAERFGGDMESEEFKLRQRMMMEELAFLRQQLMQADLQWSQLNCESASLKAAREEVEKVEPTEMDCIEYGKSDPQLKRLAEELALQKMQEEDAKNTGALKNDRPVAQKYLADRERAQRKYEERLAQLKDEIKKKKLAEIDREIKKREIFLEQINRRRSLLEKETEKLRKQAEQFGISSIEVEMLRVNLKTQEKFLEAVALERARARAELRAPSRIQLVEKASLPSE